MEKVEIIEKEGAIGVKARSVLWYLTFFGFTINYIIRINASIAIVDMIDVNFKKSSNNTVVTSECIIDTQRNFTNFTTSAELSNEVKLESKYVSLERRLLDYLGVSHVTSESRSMTRADCRWNTNATDSSGMNISSRKFSGRFSGSIG